jgi:hypothetical protein
MKMTKTLYTYCEQAGRRRKDYETKRWMNQEGEHGLIYDLHIRYVCLCCWHKQQPHWKQSSSVVQKYINNSKAKENTQLGAL